MSRLHDAIALRDRSARKWAVGAGATVPAVLLLISMVANVDALIGIAAGIAALVLLAGAVIEATGTAADDTKEKLEEVEAALEANTRALGEVESRIPPPEEPAIVVRQDVDDHAWRS